MKITETPHEFCVVVEYPDGKGFCMAKFMHEEDAREYLRTKKDAEYVKWKLYERKSSVLDENVRWEPIGV